MDEREASRVLAEATVTYGVKELLARMEERLIRIETRGEHYATREDVDKAAEANRTLIDKLAAKIDDLESQRDKVVGAAFAAVAAGAAAGGGTGWLVTLLAGGG